MYVAAWHWVCIIWGTMMRDIDNATEAYCAQGTMVLRGSVGGVENRGSPSVTRDISMGDIPESVSMGEVTITAFPRAWSSNRHAMLEEQEITWPLKGSLSSEKPTQVCDIAALFGPTVVPAPSVGVSAQVWASIEIGGFALQAKPRARAFGVYQP